MRNWVFGGTILAVLMSTLLLYSCNHVQRVEVSGRLAGYALEGPVDSEVARDYLLGRPLSRQLEQERRELLEPGGSPSREQLASLSQRYSTDLATLLFLEAVAVQPKTLAFREKFDREVAVVRERGAAAARPSFPHDLTVLMFPGWFYRTHGAETNADYRYQRELFRSWGISHRLVEFDENGTIEKNAHAVADAVRLERQRGRVFIVSASKSSAEVALALGRYLEPQETNHVVGWLSMVGVVGGSPLADRVLEPDLCWLARLQLGWEGFDLAAAKSMQVTQRRELVRSLRYPAHVQKYVVLAVPLSGQISDRAEFGYARLREYGPNDGLTLLSDELIPGATPLLVPGTDHFLGPAQAKEWSTALFRLFAGEMREWDKSPSAG